MLHRFISLEYYKPLGICFASFLYGEIIILMVYSLHINIACMVD